MAVSPGEELGLRSQELGLRKEELELKKRDSRRWWFSNSLVVAVVAALLALYGQWLARQYERFATAQATTLANAEKEAAKLDADRQLARDRKQFCHRVIADFLSRNQDSDRTRAAEELRAVVGALSLETECEGNLWQIADLFAAAPPPSLQAPAASASARAASCLDFVSIRELGWTSGHKTKFCLAQVSRKVPGRRFDGVHNPFGDYRSGGFCYAGDSDACIAEIQAAAKR